MLGHDRLLLEAKKYFPASEVIREDTFEAARDRVFNYLKEENSKKTPLERWQIACHVFHQLHLRHDEPQRSWAARILDEDLSRLLQALHKAGLAKQFTSCWPKLV